MYGASGPINSGADMTYVTTGEGWLYLATVLKVWGRRIVRWANVHSYAPDALAVSPVWQALPVAARAFDGPIAGWQVIGSAVQGLDGSLEVTCA